MKVKRVSYGTAGHRLAFMCPTCDEVHMVTDGWTYNGNADAPTFAPSVRVTHQEGSVTKTCHFHVDGGRIIYCADSTHAMAGRTVDMPDWIEGER